MKSVPNGWCIFLKAPLFTTKAIYRLESRTRVLYLSCIWSPKDTCVFATKKNKPCYKSQSDQVSPLCWWSSATLPVRSRISMKPSRRRPSWGAESVIFLCTEKKDVHDTEMKWNECPGLQDYRICAPSALVFTFESVFGNVFAPWPPIQVEQDSLA